MISVRGLSMRYEGFRALDRVSFEVEEGEIFGFIGPNGAGKTTTIRILATLLLPTAGSARVMGLDVTEEPERVRELMGYMPDAWGVYPDLTVAEYLEFFAAAYAVPRRDRPRVVGDVMDLTDLEGLRGKLVEQLSKGMRQRLCLAKTLIHDPRLLLLDEPADGLDPRARIELRELLRELRAMGKTILISSHILTELSDLVTSVGIVERGRLLMRGSLADVLARVGGVPGEASPSQGAEADGAGEPGAPGAQLAARPYTLRTRPEHGAAAVEVLLAQPAVSRAARVGAREVVFAASGGDEAAAALVRELVAAGVDVCGLTEPRADLETAFMAITRGEVQ